MTLAGLLKMRASETPDREAYVFLADGEVEAERLTWSELDARARSIATVLRESVPAIQAGERALLLYPPGLEFVAAFFGCLYAGVVAVPAYPPRLNDRSQSRLRSIARDAAPLAALTTAQISASAGALTERVPELAGARWIATDALGDLPGLPRDDDLPDPDPDSPAFLQYTSGSTSTPKGVIVTHANLVHNERMIGEAFGVDADSVVVGWLPLYHDMGLIGNVLQPLHAGARCVLMSPVAFLQRPRRWLEAIHNYRGTTSGGPNFAYELCVRKIPPEQREGLDLSSWQVAFNGAEPVRAHTLERFAEAFGPSGFRRESFYPCYGLAEATLFVSGGDQGRMPEVEGRWVSSGHAWEGQRIVIADPGTSTELPPGGEGEIWVCGPSVARGYWGSPEATERDFRARLLGSEELFLRTGDLGFLRGGELFVTGRIKDLIILRGRNHYPQDIELTAERSHPGVRPDGAAFAVEVDGEERLIVVQEVERRRNMDLDEVVAAVRRAVAEEHEIQPYEVVLVRAGTVPKTSSGKVQRHACRERYLAGELAVLGTSVVAPAAVDLPPSVPSSDVESLIRERAAAVLGLPVSAVNPERPLTSLGLDSLSAVELKGGVEAALGVPVPLADLLEGIDTRSLAARLLESLGEGGVEEVPIPQPDSGTDQPLSVGQKALWFLERLAPEAGAYNVAVAARVRDLDTEALRRALTRLVERHPALRTVFPTVGDEPVQRVLPTPEIDIAEGGSLEEAWRPFDLGRGPLLRVRILGDVLLLVVHHIVSDFWSLAVMAREVGVLYGLERASLPPGRGRVGSGGRPGGGRSEGEEPVDTRDAPLLTSPRSQPPSPWGEESSELPALPLRYSDFARWQTERLVGPRVERLRAFWGAALEGVPDLALTPDRPRPPIQTWRGLARGAELPADLAHGLRGLAAQGGTLFSALLAAFQAQLGRYADQDDFAIGIPTAGRGAPEWAGVVGYFVNPVALRTDLSGSLSFRSLLERARRTALAGLEHADYPFVLLAEQLRPLRDPARPPVFQVMLALQQRRPGDDPGLPAFALGEDGVRIALGDLELESVALPERRAQFEISLNAAELPSGALGLSLEVNADLFDAATADRMLGHFRTLVAAAVAEPDCLLSDLPLLSPSEQEELVREWAPSGPVPDACLHELVAERARQSPAADAVVVDDERLSYAELVARAGVLARRLRELGVGPEVPVGLCVERSADLVIGALGILEAGGVYLPLDPDSAPSRLAFILEDAGAAVLVTQERVAERLPETAVPVLLLQAPEGGAGVKPGTSVPGNVPTNSPKSQRDAGAYAQPGVETPGFTPAPPSGALTGNAAYLIYTSGSTGRPKGVTVTHAAAVEHCLTWARAYRMTERDRVLQFPSAGFDASVEQIFSTLLSGATLVLRGQDLWGPRELERRIEEQGLTVVDLPTAYFARWVQDAKDLEDVPGSLRLIGIGGEELRTDTARRWSRTVLSEVPLLNSYGPTEAVISATLHEVRAGEDGPVPIGRPLPGRVARVLDRHGNPQPDGVPGELCLGGVLARGYQNRPDLTAERFVPDPFGPAGARLYRTGDLVRRRPHGDIEFLGRLDDQIKIRGFRVEPGEIGAVLAGHPEVREAAVLALGSGEDQRLVAFVAPGLPDDLRAFLRERLPDYMVPAGWVALPALPLNPSGKVDRTALARLAQEAETLDVEGEAAPRTPGEELLAGIFAGLLGRERVGIHDDFFALGGHSLLATRVIAQVSRVFGVDLPVSAVFQAPTVAGLSERIASAGTAPPVLSVPRGEAMPLSFAQQRLWFLDQLELGTAVYNVPGEVRLTGPLDVRALTAAFEEILRRHEVLRTVYVVRAGAPSPAEQGRAGEGSSLLPLVDLSTSLDPESEAERCARQEARKPFDLAHGPVCRALLLRLGPEEHRLLVTFHHIASDGWSLGLFLDELSDLYAGRRLPGLPVQYADFAAWQREWLQGDVLEQQLSYWRDRLAGLPVLELPADHPRPSVRDSRGAVRSLVLPPEAVMSVERLARREGVTLFMAVLGTFQTLLARYTSEGRIPVGSPVANRRRPEVERLIGLFVNTLVLDAKVGDDPSLSAFLARVREACLGAYAHQDLPFERLVEELQPSRDLSQNPLFQVMLVLEEPLPVRASGDLVLEPVRSETGTAKFDLLVAVSPRPDGGWDLLAEHAAALFEPVTIDRLLGHWRTLLEGAVTADPGTRLSDLALLTEPERAQIFLEWNDTRAEYPAGRLHDLVAAQAERTPEAVAVMGETESLTYRELMERSSHLADNLRELGVGPEVRVGLCLQRTPGMIAAILGVLEAGGAYVPLDPAYPQERLELMLNDSGAEVLLTESALVDRLTFFSGRIVVLDAGGAAPSPAKRGRVGEGVPSNLAYVIYTSGSTGRPKGVGISHGSAVALVHWALDVFPHDDLRGVLAATSICFDLSIYEIFVPLAMGGRVILAPNIVGLPQLGAMGEVTLVNAVPSPMAEMVDGRLPAGLRTVNLAGEALKLDLVERIYAHPQVERVVNLYGPSEDTTYSTWTVVAKGASRVTIGRPIANTRARVLGPNGEPLPVGVPGELFLAGEGLARGYLGRPDLTAERFVPDPFGLLGGGERMYRTGDRVRLLLDGQLDFLGRLDHQVKLHGFRIELGEIEAVLARQPGVRQSAVMLRSDGPEGPRLVGYVVLEQEGEELPAILTAALREHLPGMMVPTAWVVLPALPLSPNGKVDRKALPAPARLELAETVSPRNPVEERLAEVWREVLGLEQVGVHDSFFELGGHSLLAVRAAFRVGEAFGVELPVAALFQAPTVAGLAQRLADAASFQASEAVLAGAAEEDGFPLSFAQQRLWFLDRLEPGSILYNLQLLVRFQGRLDADVLARALAEIVRRHEPLRTVYPEVDSPEMHGEPFQKVLPASAELTRLSLVDLTEPRRNAALDDAIRAETERPFDLRTGPVTRFLLVEMGGDEHLLAAVFHHIATDGWSLGLFSRELSALYEAFILESPSPLPELPLRYVDVAAAQHRALDGPALQDQLGYWRGQLAGVPPLDLSGDHSRPVSPSPRGVARAVDLPAGLTMEIRALGRDGITPFMVLLGGFAALLSRLSGQEDFGIGVPTAGRSRPETQGMIGLFVNTLVLRTPLDGDPGFLEIVRRVRDVSIAAQARQDVPFDRLVDELQPARSAGVTPLFQAMFAYLSDPAPPLVMPGLTATLLNVEPDLSQFDLALSLHEWEGRVRGWLTLRADLFDPPTAHRIGAQLTTLLQGAVASRGLCLSELPLLSEAERHQLLVEWNEAVLDGAPGSGVLGLLEARIAERPEAVAVVGNGESLSYGELGRRSDRLARRLLRLGLQSEARIGLLLERTPAVAVAILGAWKAGAVCVPLDPSLPGERLAWTAKDAGLAAVLTDGARPGWDLPVLDLRDEHDGDAEGALPLPEPGEPGDMAYLIYTSGTTGMPKAVMVEHGSLSRTLLGCLARFGFGPDDRMPHLAPFSFDISMFELLLPLLAGGQTEVLARNEILDLARLAGSLRQATRIHAVPSLMRQLADFLRETGETGGFPDLRTVFVGGERVPFDLVRDLREVFPSARVTVLYGPTETAILASAWSVPEEPGERGERSVLGRPLPGVELHLLDRRGNPVPLGVPGDLHIGGGGVARGYHGRPDLTAERFRPTHHGRLYRTGDLARLLPDGRFEFLGRTDQQVKIRGFRVEPGEVEALLTLHPGVREAVVLAVRAFPSGAEQSLAAYVVPAGEADLPGLRSWLRDRLPEYMVPAAWVVLSELPLNAHGKVDRRALPAPGLAAPRRGETAPAAAPELELIAGIFAELLGLRDVGAGASFFDLGGHSLLATRLVSRIRAVLGVDLPLAAVFEAPTPAGLASRLEAVRRVSALGFEPPPLVREPGVQAPLSFAQQRLWFLHQLEPDDAYHVPGGLRLRGTVREDALERTLGEIVRRHESLRTVFGIEGRSPVQIVLPPGSFHLPVVDLSGISGETAQEEAGRLREREARRPFNLEAGPLVRTLLLRLGAEERFLAVVTHHIVSDAWSLGVLLRELGTIYTAEVSGEPSPLAELPIQYPDYARWQRQWLSGEVLEREVAHWRRTLSGAPESLELPYDRPPAPGMSTRGARRPFGLSSGLWSGLIELARRGGWTSFMALLAGFHALLSRYSGQEDVVVGSPIANRTRLELEGLIGFFTNTVALRVDLSGDPTFWELGRRVRASALEAYAHQDIPFERLVEELHPDRHLGRNPLFQTMLVLQKPPAGPGLPGVEAELLDTDTGTAKFDLTLMLVEEAGGAAGVVGAMEYARDLFDPASVDRVLGHLRTLLQGAVEEPGRRLSELPLLTGAEQEELVAWSRPLTPEPPALLVHEGVSAQAERTPDAVAVVFGDGGGGGESLTYGELMERARGLAWRLRGLGVGPDVPVGLFLERSIDMMVAVLGVLEAGGAYLPLDPTWPAERLRLMLEDAHSPVLVTHGPMMGKVPPGTGTVVRVDEPGALTPIPSPAPPPPSPGEGRLHTPFEHAAPPSPREGGGVVGEGGRGGEGSGVTPAHLAYVVYTSGSTGRPKGVAMTHAAITAMLLWQQRTSAARAGRTLQFTSLSFDVSFQEIFSTWWAGGTLVLVSEDVRRDPPALVRLMAEQRIERLFLPFVALQQVALAAVAAIEEGGAFPDSLREVMSAGEQLYVTPQVAELFSRLPGAELHNHYGPSETHAVTWLSLDGDASRWPERPPIGVPVDHARVFLLDADLQPVPVGVAGEVWVGGAGLARDYLGRPRLTADRFLPDPFHWAEGWTPGDRLYRTGDLARRRPDGIFEFLGRSDSQVKIRGHRVELFEVETALAYHPAVQQAAVAVRGETSGARRLVAYLVLREGVKAPTFGELRAFLAESLPDPMVPTAWARIAELPLTPTGKLDRRALSRIEPEEGIGTGDGEAFVEPRTPAEELLARIWSEVLGVSRVGARDDFFQLGGHSLLATQVASRIREELGVDLPLRRIFEASTLATMAAAILDTEGASPAAPPIRPVPRVPGTGILPLSFAQERLWFLDRLQPGGSAYNVPLALAVEGHLDVERMAAALSGVARRHEVLRTIFPESAERDSEPVQVVLPAADISLPRVDLTGLPEARREPELRRLAAAEAVRPFDLARGPLLRALLLERDSERGLFFLNLHHIATDGWSMGLLVREVNALYAGDTLPKLPAQYADFAVWQRQWLAGEVLERQMAWWRERLRGALSALELPTDRPHPPVRTMRGANHPLGLNEELSDRVAEVARQEGVTPFMILAAGLFALLSRLTGQADLVIGTPIANRNRIETEGLIGFFVNSLVLRADLSRTETFRDLLRQVRESSLGAYAHQDVPFEKLVDELHPDRDLSRSPLFQVSLALQNAPLSRIDLGGVRLVPREIPMGVAKFDLSFAFAENEGRLEGVLEYATDLFDGSTAARLAAHWARLLAAATSAPRAPLAELPLLSAAETHQLLREWNDTATERPELCIHELFAIQAARTPDAPAVSSGGAVSVESTLTYRELDRRSDEIALRLRRLGVGPEVLVGLYLERSPEMVAALLAVLKAGGAYLPLDPAYPEDRLAFMLSDARARVLLTSPELAGRLPTGDAGEVVLGQEEEIWPEERIEAGPGPDNLAYVIYTSGSTGVPKGVMVSHRTLVASTFARIAEYREAPSVFLLLSSFAFDSSVAGIFGTLCTGGRLVVAPADLLAEGPERLAVMIESERVSHLLCVPSLWSHLVDRPEVRGLRGAIVAGEPCPAELVERHFALLPGTGLWNEYGPTECTVWSSVQRVTPGRPVTIGRPIEGARLLVLDGRGRPAPIGVPGELFVGGAGVTRGYLGRPELTASAFVPDPFGKEPGQRLYRTGDLVRWLPDGEIGFLGRIDQQVKVRGFRIELGETETALARLDGVREAVVAVREDVPGERRLVAYVVPERQPAPAAAGLREALQRTLPDYMVPWTFVMLDALPLSANGKVDRKALPSPRDTLAGPAAPIAPRTELERKIGAVWREVLHLEEVGVQESFFEVGGSSLSMAKLHGRLRHALGREIPLVDLFRHPTIESLARSLGEAAPERQEAQAEQVRARTDTRRESMRQLQQARGQRQKKK